MLYIVIEHSPAIVDDLPIQWRICRCIKYVPLVICVGVRIQGLCLLDDSQLLHIVLQKCRFYYLVFWVV
jgi:hypothetical protein